MRSLIQKLTLLVLIHVWVSLAPPCAQAETVPFVPDDPYFYTGPIDGFWNDGTFWGQWYLDKQDSGATVDINVRGAWDRGLTGEGVVIGIVDNGAHYYHPDLAPQYRSDLSWDFYDNVQDAPWVGYHGTSVAGIAVAKGGNGIGVTGVAPNAGMASLRTGTGVIYGYEAEAEFNRCAAATRYMSTEGDGFIDIKNHSYGSIKSYNTYAMSWADALRDSAEAGTINVICAQNYREYTYVSDFSWQRDGCSNKRPEFTVPEVIGVAAVNSQGTYTDYSSFGSCLFVSAPSGDSDSWEEGGFGVTTTDFPGDPGYNLADDNDRLPDLNYTSRFNGTSASAPMVSGALALAKEAQPNLDTRFAQHLLARTSRLIDPDDNSPMGGWTVNGAGLHFNNNYGFGLLDVDALTQAATQYSGVTPLQTASTGTIAVGQTIAPDDPAGITRSFTFEDFASPDFDTTLESVVVHLDFWSHGTRPYIYDIEAILRSPFGTESLLMFRKYEASSRPPDEVDWDFVSNAFWGEDPHGTWELTVMDVDVTAFGTTANSDYLLAVWNSFDVLWRGGELVAVPVPAAALLGMLGLATAGARLRRRELNTRA